MADTQPKIEFTLTYNGSTPVIARTIVIGNMIIERVIMAEVVSSTEAQILAGHLESGGGIFADATVLKTVGAP